AELPFVHRAFDFSRSGFAVLSAAGFLLGHRSLLLVCSEQERCHEQPGGRFLARKSRWEEFHETLESRSIENFGGAPSGARPRLRPRAPRRAGAGFGSVPLWLAGSAGAGPPLRDDARPRALPRRARSARARAGFRHTGLRPPAAAVPAR